MHEMWLWRVSAHCIFNSPEVIEIHDGKASMLVSHVSPKCCLPRVLRQESACIALVSPVRAHNVELARAAYYVMSRADSKA